MPTQFHFAAPLTQPGSMVNAIVPAAGASETLTATASNQQTTITAAVGQSLCRVATDVAVYVEFGASPDATSNAGGRVMVTAGAIEYFGVSVGDKAAVVTA